MLLLVRPHHFSTAILDKTLFLFEPQFLHLYSQSELAKDAPGDIYVPFMILQS